MLVLKYTINLYIESIYDLLLHIYNSNKNIDTKNIDNKNIENKNENNKEDEENDDEKEEKKDNNSNILESNIFNKINDEGLSLNLTKLRLIWQIKLY